MSEENVHPAEERRQRWLGRAASRPPEELACWVDPAPAPWVVVVEDGPEIDRKRYSAYLAEREELPYFAYALAHSYLDDVGEWPIYGMFVEAALADLETHQDPLRAVQEILAAIKPVWPEVEVTYVGREQE